MILSPESYGFNCGCGKEHNVSIEKTVIKAGAMHDINAYMEECGIKGEITAVYDENTFEASLGRQPKAHKEIVLDPKGLHADNKAVDLLNSRLGECDVIVAVGSGTIHDVSRYAAAQRGAVFVGAPTAASVDGFSSNVCAMTWHGFKTTVSAVHPKLIVADTEIIAKAPLRLNAAGVGDVIGKYISLADWKIANILTGEYYCEGIAGLVQKAVEGVVKVYPHIKNGGEDAAGMLIHALILSGVAIQICTTSRPASAAEHHISHMIELPLSWLGQTDALHGEKVGVGSIISSGIYKKMAESSRRDIEELMGGGVDFSEIYGRHELETVYESLSGDILEENKNLCSSAVNAEVLINKWDEIRDIIGTIPDESYFKEILGSLAAPCSLEEIGQEKEIHERIINWSPYVRNRLTLNRLRPYIFAV